MESEPIPCPICDGDAGLLGVLGRLAHYVCRACGMQFSRKVDNDTLSN